MRLGGLGQVRGRLKVHAPPPRLGKIGKGLEGRVVGFHAQARPARLATSVSVAGRTPVVQWPRLEAGRSDDLGTAGRALTGSRRVLNSA